MGLRDWLRGGARSDETSGGEEGDQRMSPGDAEDEWTEGEDVEGDDDDPTVYPLW